MVGDYILRYNDIVIPIYNSSLDLSSERKNNNITNNFQHNIILKINTNLNNSIIQDLNIMRENMNSNVHINPIKLEILTKNSIIVCECAVIENYSLEMNEYGYGNIIINLVSDMIQLLDCPILHQRKFKIDKILQRMNEKDLMLV
jgi:hypothetical protein